jgi:protein-arginine kinase activator protein McsA
LIYNIDNWEKEKHYLCEKCTIKSNEKFSKQSGLKFYFKFGFGVKGSEKQV